MKEKEQKMQSVDLKGKSIIVAQYPKFYLFIWKFSIVVCVICMAIVSFTITKPDEKKEIITFICIMIIVILLFHILFARYKIILYDAVMVVTPLIGKTKTIKYEQITDIKVRRSNSLTIYYKNKRLFTVDAGVVGYDQIVENFKNRGLM